MFEFITISNGIAVVQHAPSGQVYRFRPEHRGVWSTLTPSGVGDAVPPASGFDDLGEAARTFAETFASALFGAVSEPSLAAQPLPKAVRWPLRLWRRRDLD